VNAIVKEIETVKETGIENIEITVIEIVIENATEIVLDVVKNITGPIEIDHVTDPKREEVVAVVIAVDQPVWMVAMVRLYQLVNRAVIIMMINKVPVNIITVAADISIFLI
jgi:hypothetical protein